MTKEDLRVLATIPRVIKALEAFNAEQDKLRRAMTKAGQAPRAEPMRATERPPVPENVAIILDTPERQEWAAQQSEVAQALRAERELLAPKKPIVLPFAQRRAVEQGLLQDAGVRAAKLQQFARDGNGLGHDVVVAETEITNMAEVT